MKKGNSDDGFDHAILPFSLHMTAHCAVVRSQYRHAEADREVLHSSAIASITFSEGEVVDNREVTTVAGIRSSAAKSSACLSSSFELLSQPYMSLNLQIAPPSSCFGKT
jgi:hypothetical protein